MKKLNNKSYKHWVVVALMCSLSASSIGLCTNSIGVFYTPVSESLKVLKGTFAFHDTLSSLAIAIVSLLMSICIFVLIIPALIYPWQVDPKKSGLLPYGFKNEHNIETVITERKFNVITISFICMCFFTVMHTSITGISKHLSGIATSIDLSATIGAAMMSLAMIGNIISKLIIGFISDILNPIKACVIMILTNVVAICFFYEWYYFY